MDVLKFARIINSEADAIRFLVQCLKRHHRHRSIVCSSCKSKKHYIMNKGYARCQRCLTDYDPFSNTQFGMLRISYTKWLTVIKLFDLGISARRAAREAGLSYPTTLKAFDVIRYSILYHLAKSDKILNGEIEADEAYFGGKRKGNRGRGAKNKTIVFGILERGGKVSVSIIQNVSAETLMSQTVRR